MKKMELVKAKLKATEKIVITSHVSPDGDAIGSSLGLYNYLKSQHFEHVQIVVPNAFPQFLKWLPNVEDIIIYDENEAGKRYIDEATILFCLDYNEPFRTSVMQDAIKASKAFKILIDHHLGEPTWPDVNLSVVGASSTCELVYDFLKSLSSSDDFLTEDIAYPLYTGILTDTGNFQYSATTASVHIAAAHLIEAGVQADIVHNHINNSFDQQRLQFFGFAIAEKMTILTNKKIAYTALSMQEMRKYNIKTGGTEALVNEAMKINDIEVSILVKEDKDKVKLSFRSKGNIDVSAFANKYFKGGGHKNAAGGVSFLSLEETIAKLEEKLKEF